MGNQFPFHLAGWQVTPFFKSVPLSEALNKPVWIKVPLRAAMQCFYTAQNCLIHNLSWQYWLLVSFSPLVPKLQERRE